MVCGARLSGWSWAFFIVLTRALLRLRKRRPVGFVEMCTLVARKPLLLVGVMTLHSFTEGVGVGVAFGGGQDFGLFITLMMVLVYKRRGSAQASPSPLYRSLSLLPLSARASCTPGVAPLVQGRPTPPALSRHKNSRRSSRSRFSSSIFSRRSERASSSRSASIRASSSWSRSSSAASGREMVRLTAPHGWTMTLIASRSSIAR